MKWRNDRRRERKPRWSPEFFQASLRNCINCVLCDDHFFLEIQLREGSPTSILTKWVGTIAIKTERTRIRFLSDVFAAVRSSDRKVLINVDVTPLRVGPALWVWVRIEFVGSRLGHPQTPSFLDSKTPRRSSQSFSRAEMFFPDRSVDRTALWALQAFANNFASFFLDELCDCWLLVVLTYPFNMRDTS